MLKSSSRLLRPPPLQPQTKKKKKTVWTDNYARFDSLCNRLFVYARIGQRFYVPDLPVRDRQLYKKNVSKG